MPKDLKGWRDLIREAAEQMRIAAGEKQRIAIVGPVNVGKSTLYNRLIRSTQDRASVSAIPGTTRISKQADAGIFAVIDTPGADTVGIIGEEERQQAFLAAKESDLLVVMFDAAHGIHALEKELFDDLIALRKPLIVVLNKMDLVHRERSTVLGKAAAALSLESEAIIPLSAKKGKGFDRFFLAIVKSEPGVVAALGAALPGYRRNLAQATIAKATSTAAAIAATPLPFLDFFL
jgi:small GTP-binding protein